MKRRKRDADKNPARRRHDNPLLDTREYEVEFQDGATDMFTANIIAESMYSQVDEVGNSYSLISEIVDHKSGGTPALRRDDDFEQVNTDGRQRHRHTTRGWKLLVTWKDGSTSWVVQDLKESFPVQVAQYAVVSNNMVEEPAFAWWAKHVLRKRDRIITKVKSRYWDRTHKYGNLLPKTVKDAFRIDKEMGTDFWQGAVELETKAIDFEFCDDDKMPVEYQHIDCHMIFDVKITLDRKAIPAYRLPHYLRREDYP
jgi:hypothetical protein